MVIKYCIDCGKKLANFYAKRCQKHANWIVTRSLIGKKLTEEHKTKLKASWDYNKHITPIWRKKQSELRKGIPVTPLGSKWSKKQRDSIMKEKSNRDPKKELERRRKISETHSGSKAYQWKGGRTITPHGYIWILIGKKKYKFEHRIIMEKYLGRLLTAKEQIHHIDGNKKNNKIDNLMLFANARLHTLHHNHLTSSSI